MRDPAWAPPVARSAEVAGWEEVRERLEPMDVAALAGVPAFLVLVFVLFGSAPDRLTLSYASPTPLSALTAHYVHGSVDHLVANLAAYAFVVPTAYILSVVSGRRREFGVALVGFLLVLPPVLSGLVLVGFERGVAFGFSGVTMAFVGLLPVFLGSFVGDGDFPAGIDDLAPGLFFLGLGLIAVRSIPTDAYRLPLAVAAVATAIAYLRGPIGKVLRGGRSLRFLGSGRGEVATLGLLAFLVGVLVGFPGHAADGPVVVNIYGHLLGYALGFVAPYSVIRFTGRWSASAGGG